MSRMPSAALLAVISAAALMAPQTSLAEANVEKVRSLEGITEYKLDNGLQILLYPDQSKPTVTVNMTVFVGSRHEGYGETGMAHLLEHMLFKGTPTHGDIPRLLQQRGANFNGTTWVDRTNYYETLPATDDNLEFAIALEADRLVNSYVKREDLLSEMTVVRNEFERGENSPERILDQRLLSVAFDWHNYGKSTIGNRSDIERVPIENLQAFYRKYYQPDNTMLVVAGKFDEEKALSYIKKHFGPLARSKEKRPDTYTEEPPQDGERVVTLRRVGDVAMVGVVYHAPSGSHPDNAALEILGHILDAPPAGRLYKALVEKRLATSVAAGVTSWHDPGVFQAQAEVRKEDSLEKARDVLIEVVEGVGDTEITAAEVDRARQKVLKQRELDAADTSSVAIDLSNWASQGDWRLYLLHRDRIESVTADDVQRVANKYLVRNNRTLGMFIPTDKTERVPVPASPDLAKLFENFKGREDIALGEAFDVSPEAIESRLQRVTVGDNIKAVLLPKKTRGETVFVRIVLRYGSPDNLKGYEAAAKLLPPLMTRGTKELSRQEIQDALDRNLAVMQAQGEVGVATFVVQTKKDKLADVLDIVRQVLREPALDKDEFETLRRQYLASYEQALSDPQTRAITEVRRHVSPYPKGDVRYTPTVAEEVERMESVKLDEVKELYKFLSAQAGEVAVVGDFEADAVRKQLEEIVQDWTTDKPYERIERKTFADVKGSKQRIEIPDKANAVYMAGLAFPMSDTHPDYAAVTIGNEILGAGALSSRLGDRVRQKEGLSYGIASYVRAESLDERASLTIAAITNPANIDKVAKAIDEEIELLWKEGVEEDELQRAISGYLQQESVNRTNDMRLAQILTDTAYADRTMEYYAKLEKQISELTPQQVVEALRKHLDPSKLAIVTAGDFSNPPQDGASNSEPTE